MNSECQGFHLEATRPREQPRASRCENKAPCSCRRARRKREVARGWRVQTTRGRDREINRSISGSSWPQSCLEDTMFLPHPHSKDPAQEPRQANPNRAVGAGVQCPSDGDEDPPLTPKRGGSKTRAGLVRSLNLVLCSRFWLGVGALPLFPRILSRTPQNRPSASDTRMCLTHSGACVRAAPGGARRQTARRRGELGRSLLSPPYPGLAQLQ